MQYDSQIWLVNRGYRFGSDLALGNRLRAGTKPTDGHGHANACPSDGHARASCAYACAADTHPRGSHADACPPDCHTRAPDADSAASKPYAQAGNTYADTGPPDPHPKPGG